MNTATHTPTPYTSRREGAALFSICSPNVEHVATTRGARCEENAAFIVRACNAHDDLVAALRKIAVYVGVNEMTVSPTRPVAPYVMQDIARAALAKAGAQ